MKNSLLPILILFSLAGFGQNDSMGAPKIGIKVPDGQTVVISGISIKFVEVLEDSRCPTDVECIWAGRARVKVSVSSNGKETEKILTFGALRPGEEKNTNLYSSSEFAINGLTLN